jgi:hypothetical protein
MFASIAISNGARIPYCRTMLRVGFVYPLHSLQGHSVSNAVSNAKKFEHSLGNFCGQKS